MTNSPTRVDNNHSIPANWPKDNPHDLVNYPPHYTSHPSGIECIQITRHMNFNRGNALAYLWRAGLKGNVEQEILDLEKAIWHLNDEIQRLKSK